MLTIALELTVGVLILLIGFCALFLKSLFEQAYRRGQVAGVQEASDVLDRKMKTLGGAFVYPDGPGRMKAIMPAGVNEQYALSFADRFRHVEDYRELLDDEKMGVPMPSNIRDKIVNRVDVMQRNTRS